ncbi:ABC transporter [Erysipelothrix larvae]|uniref:ABC transporter n=1 Tax=Erysipelothrix larvae TaxID=1514105 RepID=A0A109UGP4_9FIRM|nr:ABC transporter ATP-binding protein/permease [Erysipelothrix larvae]AMC92868.1 ABC transporter [Erysipelothrix larvae]
MLQIKDIRKKYVTGDLTQIALDGVSFNLRDSEMVAILGQSGSGKTTTLNIIGGLDHYDSGDIIINGISTKNYTDRDWDSYRNHTVGFVFQSYNLIPHQTILSNVELALTISGVSNAERKKRAIKALEDVGLGTQVHKKPNQMSGGQMQRVAIARALVNDPDILLADEPTGALDSETSVVVMDLLKEIAKDRLVVLVTHNQELAEAYATRIIRLHDGQIVSDSNPLIVDETKLEAPKHKNLGKTSMSFRTALSLSFNNLRTKMGRTFLTSFAGSIGIIGIALILSLSSGVNAYIDSIQRDTMASYPITLQSQSMDLSSILSAGPPTQSSSGNTDRDRIYSNSTALEMVNQATSSIRENNLTEFKKYLDDPESEIHAFVGENGIIFSYDVAFTAYAFDPDGNRVNTDGSTFEDDSDTMFGSRQASGPMAQFMTSSNFVELIHGNDDLVGQIVLDNYQLLEGAWPKQYDEVVLVVDQNNEISLTALFELGILPSEDYKEILDKIDNGEEIEFEEKNFSYEEIMKQEFVMIPASHFYEEGEDGLFTDISDNEEKLEALIDNSVRLKISGVISPVEDASYQDINGVIGYTRALTDYVIEETNNAPVVKAQEANPDKNILNGLLFEPKDDAAKIEDASEYLARMGVSDKATLFRSMLRLIYADDPQMMAQLSSLSEIEQAAMLDQYLQNPEDDVLLQIYETYISTGSFDDNMSAFGVVSLDAPASISIYADSFEDKDGITQSIANYNETVSAENQITFTDYVGLLMSSVTTIVNVVSYVLIAFVAVSLVVSSIMIGIITFISVLERTKEIGILRAIGASKRNISNVFNAETFIIGLFSGLLGIGITLLLLIPINSIIHSVTGTTAVNAALPVESAGILVLLSLSLTVIAGLIPASKAAKKDPVIALRSE